MNTPLAEPEKKVTSGKVWNWMIQIMVWLSLGGMVIGCIFEARYYINPGIYIQYIVIWITYFINSLCSNNFSFLRHMQQGNTIHSFMGKLFYTPAFVDFHISCYHMVTRRVRTKNGYSTSRHRVTTYSETKTFQYMTWRDVSGPFNLNISGFAKDPKLGLVKLRLKYDLEFANDGTAIDFECQRQFFINRNKHRDVHYEFQQNNRFEGYNEFNLINIDNKPHPSINVWFHVLATFLNVVEFYKLYVESFCIRQEYKIIKLVSTRNNLNLQTVFEPYMERLPQIQILDNTVQFNDPSMFSEVNAVPDLPEMSELEKNEMMKNFTPGIGPGAEIRADPNYIPPDSGNDKVEQEGSHSGSYGYDGNNNQQQNYGQQQNSSYGQMNNNQQNFSQPLQPSQASQSYGYGQQQNNNYNNNYNNNNNNAPNASGSYGYGYQANESQIGMTNISSSVNTSNSINVSMGVDSRQIKK